MPSHQRVASCYTSRCDRHAVIPIAADAIASLLDRFPILGATDNPAGRPARPSPRRPMPPAVEHFKGALLLVAARSVCRSVSLPVYLVVCVCVIVDMIPGSLFTLKRYVTRPSLRIVYNHKTPITTHMHVDK